MQPKGFISRPCWQGGVSIGGPCRRACTVLAELTLNNAHQTLWAPWRQPLFYSGRQTALTPALLCQHFWVLIRKGRGCLLGRTVTLARSLL